MKRIAIATILFTLPLLASCESRLFHFVFDLNKTSVFGVDESGSFSMQEYISAEEILNEIDLPGDARITGVDVEALSLRVIVKPENEASNIVVSGSITPLGGGKQFLFRNQSVSLIGVDTLFGLNSLIEVGVSTLKNKLEGIILHLDPEGYNVGIEGSTDPGGSRVVVDIDLRVKATIKYDQCTEVLEGFMDGEKCE
jgi:hypothetical protein